LRAHFVSNVDGTHIIETLKQLDAENDLIYRQLKNVQHTGNTHQCPDCTRVVSRKNWAMKKPCATFCSGLDQSCRHYKFGINPQNVLSFGIGSVDAILYGLRSVCLLRCISGWIGFEELLAGAHSMDEHFRAAPLDKNIPVLLGLLGIWLAIFSPQVQLAYSPNDQYLHRFPAYLQQLEMESNAKA